MAAFVLSTIVALAGIAAVWAYSRRRKVGAPLSWGEAIVAATFGFALMFWCYGVVPHQWLTFAGADLGWRPDRVLVGPKLWFTGEEGVFQYFAPFTLNYENLAHIVVTAIYGLFLAIHVAAWVVWQNRAKSKAVVVPTSEYGRPLVKQA
ncbi:MAG: hypothetical protein H0W25_17395 [Acidimicrobiia bacterium]|nr:hypothetical protein [Acidimicrobiia bacterium]